MTESYSGPITTDDPEFLFTSALYAVRSEISLRGIPPTIKTGWDIEYIQVGKLKIFVGYYIMNDETIQHKLVGFPSGKHHAYVLRLRYGVEQGFVILAPEWIQILYQDGLIIKQDDRYLLDLKFLPSKEILLENRFKMNRFLERWGMLLKGYV